MLQAERPVFRSSSISNLGPVLDQDRVIRVGGRLIHASLKYEKKQQVIIPHSSQVT